LTALREPFSVSPTISVPYPLSLVGEPKPRRIMLVTDAWEPQVNGVVRTLSRLVDELRDMGCEVEIVSPSDGYRTLPLPTYSEIRLAVGARQDIEDRFERFAPDAVHIATEGPLGWAARAVCLQHNFPFTTCYHTQYPEYVNARFGFIPLWAGYGVMRAFHDKSGRIMASSQALVERLEARGFSNITMWNRGVDTELFNPNKRGIDGGVYRDLKGPVFVYVGRVAVEKNLEAFLGLDLPGSKVVVGDGPAREMLAAKYPSARFVGVKGGVELARHFADADCLVFPSLTETFGMVILESLAAGTPVAGFDAPGPKDLIPGNGVGAIGDDLRAAALDAVACSREVCRQYAEQFSWRASAEEFRRHLQPLPRPEKKRFWRRLRALRRFRGLPRAA
jgi:glycosyltransferase involved in cell wall biosynthesis